MGEVIGLVTTMDIMMDIMQDLVDIMVIMIMDTVIITATVHPEVGQIMVITPPIQHEVQPMHSTKVNPELLTAV